MYKERCLGWVCSKELCLRWMERWMARVGVYVLGGVPRMGEGTGC